MAEGTNDGAYAGAAATRISRGCLSSIGLRMFLIFTLAVMALLYYELALSGPPPHWGSDFHIFYAASSVFAHHGNPYDMGHLFTREELLFHPVGYWRHALAGELYPQSPLLLILLRPLLALPVMNAYLVMACVLIVSILGTLALLQRLYPASGAVRRICLLAVSPPCYMGVHDGQIDALLLLALTAALLAVESRRFAVAGMLLSVGLIKPNLCLGAIILMWFLARRRGGARRYVLGLTGSTLICIVLWSVVGRIETSRHWVQGIAYFSAHIAGSMASDPSLTTLYGGWSSRMAYVRRQ